MQIARRTGCERLKRNDDARGRVVVELFACLGARQARGAPEGAGPFRAHGLHRKPRRARAERVRAQLADLLLILIWRPGRT